jgi:diguanylate cyclase (GGDEF)-like protein
LVSTKQDARTVEIEAALASPGYRLRFVPRLEASYEAARAPGRNRGIAGYLVVYLLAKLIFLWCNLQVGTMVFRVSMTLRLGIVLPLTALAVYLLMRTAPEWVKGFAAIVPVTAETALVMLLGRLSGSAMTDRYVFAAGVGIFAQTLLMPVPFRYAVRGLAVNLAVFVTLCVAGWPGHFGPHISRDLIVFVVGFSLPALYERHSQERSQRRDFLHNELNKLHVEDILRMNAHLDRLSHLDGLTGIYNRRYLDTVIKRACKVARTRGRWVACIMLDIDHFKAVNDTAGHPHGDTCLEQVARILQNSVRAGMDTVARYGGEEFCAVLPDADELAAVAIGERVRRSIEQAGITGAHGNALTVSIGVAAVRGGPACLVTADELIASADQALYTAKRIGRNRVICSTELPGLAADGGLGLALCGASEDSPGTVEATATG